MKNGKGNFGFSYMYYMKYGKFWSVLPGRFIKHKPLFSEEWRPNAINSIEHRVVAAESKPCLSVYDLCILFLFMNPVQVPSSDRFGYPKTQNPGETPDFFWYPNPVQVPSSDEIDY